MGKGGEDPGHPAAATQERERVRAFSIRGLIQQPFGRSQSGLGSEVILMASGKRVK